MHCITLCPTAPGTAPRPDSDLGGPQLWECCAPTGNRAFLVGRKNKAGFAYLSSTHIVLLSYRGTGRINFYLQEGKASLAPPPPQQCTVPFATKSQPCSRRKAGYVASPSLHPHDTNRDQQTSIHTTRIDLTYSEGTSG